MSDYAMFLNTGFGDGSDDIKVFASAATMKDNGQIVASWGEEVLGYMADSEAPGNPFGISMADADNYQSYMEMDARFNLIDDFVGSYLNMATQLLGMSDSEKDVLIKAYSSGPLAESPDGQVLRFLIDDGVAMMAEEEGGDAEKSGFFSRVWSRVTSTVGAAGQMLASGTKRMVGSLTNMFKNYPDYWRKYGQAYTEHFPAAKGTSIEVKLSIPNPSTSEVKGRISKAGAMLSRIVNQLNSAANELKGGGDLTEVGSKFKQQLEDFAAKMSSPEILGEKAVSRSMPMPAPSEVESFFAKDFGPAMKAEVTKLSSIAAANLKAVVATGASAKRMKNQAAGECMKLIKASSSFIKSMFSKVTGWIMKVISQIKAYYIKAFAVARKHAKTQTTAS